MYKFMLKTYWVMNKKSNSYKLWRYWCEYTWKLTKVSGVIL